MFWTCFIEVMEVNASKYLTILLLDRHNISLLGWVLDRLYKAKIPQLLSLLFD